MKADDDSKEGGDGTRADAGGGFRWSADVAPAPPEKLSRVATVVFALAALAVFVAGFYSNIIFEWRLPRIVAVGVLFTIVVAMFFVIRAVDLPIARWRRRRAARDPAGAARSERIAAIVATGVLVVAVAIVTVRWRMARLDPLKDEWAADRAALVAGDVLGFDRRWDIVRSAASTARSNHSGMRDEIEEYVRACVGEARRIVVDRWPQVVRHLGSRDAVFALLHNEALHGTPGLAHRVRQFETDLQTRGVVADIVCVGDDWPGWRKGVLASVRDVLPDAYVVTEWPSDVAPPSDVPKLSVEFAVESARLVSRTGSKTVTLLLPVKGFLRITATGRPLGVALPAGVVEAGPLPLVNPRDAASPGDPPHSRTQAQAVTDRSLYRVLLILLLRRELGLDAPEEASPAGEPPPDVRGK